MNQKYINILIAIFAIFQCSAIYSQKPLKVVRQTKIPGIANVKSLGLLNDEIAVYGDSIYILSKHLKIKAKRKSEKNYYSSTGYSRLHTNGSIIDLNGNILKVKKGNRQKAKCLTNYKENYYCCLVDSVRPTYSNQIVILDNQETSMFTFLCGEPVGLYATSEHLWYLYRQSSNSSIGLLRQYDTNTGLVLMEYELPVSSPVGVLINDGKIITLSEKTNEIFELLIK